MLNITRVFDTFSGSPPPCILCTSSFYPSMYFLSINPPSPLKSRSKLNGAPRASNAASYSFQFYTPPLINSISLINNTAAHTHTISPHETHAVTARAIATQNNIKEMPAIECAANRPSIVRDRAFLALT